MKINPYSHFPDPYISGDQYIKNSLSKESVSSAQKISTNQEIDVSKQNLLQPIITKTIGELPDESIIVYRGSPTGYCAGPNIQIPILNVDVDNGQEHSQVFVSCTSTYPEAQPYNPIADRYEVRLYKDGWILTLADGCGLHISSRLAPKAAMEGFWDFLSERLKNDHDGFKTQKLATYLHEAIEAGHFNIYWDAYLRNQDGYTAHKETVINNLKSIQGNAELGADKLKEKQESVSSELNTIIDALKGDRPSQKRLVEGDLNKGFYENFAGATTFLCSALIKGSSTSENPYYLLSVGLGDCKGYLLREGQLVEVTKDSRDDISNARDPGGKIGLCTPVPLLIDNRNLQYSLTPCQSKDTLFFMTDGVVDNLDPERLGLHPNAQNSSESINKIKEASGLAGKEVDELLALIHLNASSWRDISLEEGNRIKSLFAQNLLEKIVVKADTPKLANENISKYCHAITSEHRDEKPHFFNLFGNSTQPIGKPDHTTVITLQVP